MDKVAGLKLKNPYMNASGLLSGINILSRWQEFGVGAVVTKTITLKSRQGDNILIINKEKRYAVNRMGLPNPGLEKAIELLKQHRAEFKVPLIVSILAIQERKLAKNLSPYADAFELNVSCPNEEHNVPNIGYNSRLLRKVCQNVLNVSDKPLIVKLPPYLGNEEGKLLKPLEKQGITLRAPLQTMAELKETVKMLDLIGVDGITMCNTIAVTCLDERRGKVEGGLSATKINKEITMRNIKTAREVSDIDIIASGGVRTKKDADDYFRIGANAVQLGSGYYFRGFEKFVRQFV